MAWLNLKPSDKVLVMMSGGLESSVAAQRVLAETDAELLAVNINGPHWWHQHEQDALEKISSYLRTHRDFELLRFKNEWPCSPSICHLVHFTAGTVIRHYQDITHWVRTAKFDGERHEQRRPHSQGILDHTLFWEPENRSLACTIFDPFDHMKKEEVMVMAEWFVLRNFVSCHHGGNCGECVKCKEKENGFAALTLDQQHR